jgi:hypothetical protein
VGKSSYYVGDALSGLLRARIDGFSVRERREREGYQFVCVIEERKRGISLYVREMI